jgi:hypothetical protein
VNCRYDASADFVFGGLRLKFDRLVQLGQRQANANLVERDDRLQSLVLLADKSLRSPTKRRDDRRLLLD